VLRGALARVNPGGATGSPRIDPSDEQVTASRQLGPEQRKAMIEGMVERLSERLHRDGADVDGWLRLVRSYLVLGQPEKARAAVIDARRALAGDAIKLRRLDDLLRGLGLEG
jgi:cytochrome c-type biogenesis protein CcmH